MPDQTYHSWLADLERLAQEVDLGWLVSPGSETHRASWQRGLRPEEELTALQDISEWRGCGCGGG
jgi:hypothetical protein